jgi:hypothetical protein
LKSWVLASVSWKTRLLGVFLCPSGRPLAGLGIVTSKLSFICERIVLFDNDAAQMTASNPRAGWEKVGDQFYRKIQLYESVFDPDLELENYLVAGAPYGGAIGRWQ